MLEQSRNGDLCRLEGPLIYGAGFQHTMAVNLINPQNGKPLVDAEGGLIDEDRNFFPYKGGAYRFVRDEGYAASFGYEWNKFQRLQIDKFNGTTQSRDRFFAVTNWDELGLRGENILEVGSGAGRFTQVILDCTEANLYSVDYSAAVEANFRNNGPNPRLKLCQANIYELPFEKESFDRAFCFGTLQHTPDVRKSVSCLIDMVKPGGEVVVDFYPLKGFWTKLQAKYLFRPFTKKMDHNKLMSLITKHIDWMMAVCRLSVKLKIGAINRFIPIVDIRLLPEGLQEGDFREWAILDTFDMFSPEFDQPQRIKTIVHYFLDNQMTNVFGGFVQYGNKNSVAAVKGIKGRRVS